MFSPPFHAEPFTRLGARNGRCRSVPKKVAALFTNGHCHSLVTGGGHADDSLRSELETHLKLLQRTGIISTWHDRKIEAGDDWKRAIDENLEQADIILLLVSADFMASDYCYQKEMARALEREQLGEAKVIPIIVRDLMWKTAPFAKLQVFPKDGRPVTQWQSRDAAWRNVTEGIERVVRGILTERVGSVC